jgi:hypothetical protein
MSVDARYTTLRPHTSLAGPHSRLKRPSASEFVATTAVAMTLLVRNSSCSACSGISTKNGSGQLYIVDAHFKAEFA